MPTCAGCKQSHFGMFELKGGFCKKCQGERDASKKVQEAERKELGRKVDVSSILLTTEDNPSGLFIHERLGIVSAECAFGMNAFKDLFAGVRDIVGGRSEALQATLRDSREIVLSELRLEAAALGANAVIAIDLEYVELSTGGTMVLLVANGTAVTLEK